MWALELNGVVIETSTVDPEGRYHPELRWRVCESKVQPGWLFQNGVFAEKTESQESRRTAERLWRDSELSSQLWLRDRHRDEQSLGRPTTLSSEQFTELMVYLQFLRDWPVSEYFPEEKERPCRPVWIESQSQ